MELLIIVMLVLINGVFAMYEIALVSVRKTRLEEKAKFGRAGAKTALRLLEEPEKVLSAIQVGITLIGIVSGAYGGLILADDLAPFFEKTTWLAPYAHTLAVAVVICGITYLSIIIGELAPKTIALNHAEAIAIALSPAMKLLSTVMYPAILFLSVSTKLVLKLFHIKDTKEAPVSDEELRILLKKGSDYGVFEKEESDIINEVIRFGDKRANALMTHRVDVDWIDMKHTVDQILTKALSTSHPRLLVCEHDIDHIKGVASVKDLLAFYIRHQSLRLEEIIYEPIYIPEQAQALKVLDLFRKTKIHFGIVINEYGSVEGIITLHDLAENIMGDLPERESLDEPNVFQREDGSYLVDGSMMVQDIEDLLKVRTVFDVEAERPDVNTVGGLAMYKLNRIPKTGDKFSASGYVFEIVDMDGNRVDKLLVKAL
jgi:putative hemolysin